MAFKLSALISRFSMELQAFDDAITALVGRDFVKPGIYIKGNHNQ